MLDTNLQDPIHQLFEKGEIRENIKNIKQMNIEEFFNYIKLRIKIYRNYNEKWIEILSRK